MDKKILSLIVIFIYLFSGFLPVAFASESTYKGHIESENVHEKQDENFTGSFDKLNNKKDLLMKVTRVLDSTSSKNGDEFFAVVTNDIEAKDGVIMPSDTIFHGKIRKVTNAKRLGRDGGLDLEFDYFITPDGKESNIKGNMSTRLHPVISTSKVLATDIGYTALGGVAGSFLALNFLGLGSAIATNGSTVAGGAAIGGTVGLGIALYHKGENVLISPDDEIRVKIDSSKSFPVYKKTAFLQREINYDGLDVKIKDITYEKDPFGEPNIIKLSLSISNMTPMEFSISELALINNNNCIYYPTTFGEDRLDFAQIKPNSKNIEEIQFSIDNIKNKFWLLFYDKRDGKMVAKISINNAYSKLSNKSKMRNNKLFDKKNDFHKEDDF